MHKNLTSVNLAMYASIVDTNLGPPKNYSRAKFFRGRVDVISLVESSCCVLCS